MKNSEIKKATTKMVCKDDGTLNSFVGLTAGKKYTVKEHPNNKFFKVMKNDDGRVDTVPKRLFKPVVIEPKEKHIVIKPMTSMVYFDSDIRKITGLQPMYKYNGPGNAELEYFYGKGKQVPVSDIKLMIEKYMKKHKIVPKDARVSSGINATHHWGSENEDGGRPSVYGLRMNITVK